MDYPYRLDHETAQAFSDDRKIPTMHKLLAIKEPTDECPVMLKDRAMARVRIHDELRSIHRLEHCVGIAARKHCVVVAVHNERRLRDRFEAGVTRIFDSAPSDDRFGLRVAPPRRFLDLGPLRALRHGRHVCSSIWARCRECARARLTSSSGDPLVSSR